MPSIINRTRVYADRERERARVSTTVAQESERICYLEAAHKGLVDAHHATGIVKFAAVVGRGEEGDKLPLCEELVAVLDDLVRSADQVHVVTVQELWHHVRSERKGHPSVVLTPALQKIHDVVNEHAWLKIQLAMFYFVKLAWVYF